MPGSNAHGSMPARWLSVSRQISERNDRKPFGLPSVNGELANSAVADRLQRQRDAQLLHHVGFGGEVEVRLHRAGAVHHVEAVACRPSACRRS